MGGGVLVNDEEASGSSVFSVRGRWRRHPQPVCLTDVENASPNSFKKMYTDHKNVTQRKCLLMRVPSLGFCCFNPHKKCTTAQIQNNHIDNPFNTNDSALSDPFCSAEMI